MIMWEKLYNRLFSNKTFYLMHEDDSLAIFDISNLTVKNIEIIKVNSFFGNEMDLFKQISNRGLVDLNLLPSDNDLYNLLIQDSGLIEERRLKIVNLYNDKISYLYEFQNGKNIWNYIK